jgi:Ser/Thr protein kinase RdoA (MazF antagonist)
MSIDLIEDLFQETWGLSGTLVEDAVSEIEKSRSVGLVTSREGKFVYKVADVWKTKEAMDQDLAVFTLLPQKGFTHIPGLVKTKSGDAYQEIEGRYVYLMECIEGVHPEPTAETYAKLGDLTADLHMITDYPYKAEFQPAAIGEKNLRTIAERVPFKDEYLKLLATLPAFDSLPESLVHTDIALVNVMERPNGEFVLLDLEEMGMGVRILDVALPLIHRFVSEDLVFSEENARAFYRAYLAKISLTEAEKELFFPAALFTALMYIVYGDTTKRWHRIQWALENRAQLESVIA